jgi:hypothetical protein
MPRPARPAPLIALLLLAVPVAAPAQEEWPLETLRSRSEAFQQDGVVTRLRQIAELVGAAGQARPAIAASIHGDHREYQLKIERYLDQLRDDRWLSREDAERTLIEIGGRAVAQIEERAKQGATLEERLRSARILDAIATRGTEDEDREIRLLRGLVLTAPYLGADERLRKALISALGHTDPVVVEGATRALGAVGTADDVPTLVARARSGAGQTGTRRAALEALGELRAPSALAAIADLLGTPDLLRTSDATAVLRSLWLRADAGPTLEALRTHPDPAVAALAALGARPGPSQAPARPARFQLADRADLAGKVAALSADTLWLPDTIEGLPVARLRLSDCDALEFDRPVAAVETARMFLTQGTLLAGELRAIDAETVEIQSATFGAVRVARGAVQGLALDPALDRLVGASTSIDRVRLRDNSLVDGEVLGLGADGLRLRGADGQERLLARTEVAGVLFKRPSLTSSDDEVYTRIETVTGERLLAHLGLFRADQLGLAVPGIGATLLPLEKVARIEFGVGGGAMWGFTLIADYSDNRIVEIDDAGREVFALEDVYGAWDAECLDNGNLLVTEFALNRIVEVTRAGEVVWSFEELKNPYDADRLPNGNTLIADTFGERVIEVTPDGKVAWTFGGVKPYDVDRLPNGNTLIADGSDAERVLEVDPAGNVVWELPGIASAFDADRLPNGNTLVTQRQLHRVIELDREGNVVFTIENLNSPSDADRLPNGNTLIAESGGIREFDRRGTQVAAHALQWAVEVNRY